MKLDMQMMIDDLGEVTPRAMQAEQSGFAGLWSVEATHDPFLPLALAAINTTRIQVGTSIAVAFARSPYVAATVAWNIQKASKGRMQLGLGTQVKAHIERRFSMVFDHPAERLQDYVRCIRSIWNTFQTDAKPSYEGPFYQFKLINPFFNPGPIEHPHIPIHLAGINPIICKAIGEVADGFHAHPMNSATYLKDVVRPALDEGAKLNDKRVEDLEVFLPCFYITGETQAEWDGMVQETKRQISFYGSTPNYERVLAHHGHMELSQTLRKMARQGEWSEMGKQIPDSLLDSFAVVAKPADLASALKTRYEGLAQRISLYYPMPGEDSVERMMRFAQAFADVQA